MTTALSARFANAIQSRAVIRVFNCEQIVALFSTEMREIDMARRVIRQNR